ncbi:uncharacterized protein CDAR_556331 [Caerostris darwini]|uniref:VWFC domain-containing protein n=1 Tax=Caerostris darwini TaxID=1538125 RepID=A0AAV4WCA6_9ARAC|nr:uncharacterized protein CDAR_556331 [Caerostris darwini]
MSSMTEVTQDVFTEAKTTGTRSPQIEEETTKEIRVTSIEGEIEDQTSKKPDTSETQAITTQSSTESEEISSIKLFTDLDKITEKSTEFLSTSTSFISEEGKETKLEEKHKQTTSILFPVTDASTHKKLFEESTPSSFTSEAETSTFKKTTVTESPDFETTTVSTDISPKIATSTLSSEEDIKTGTPKTTLGTASSTFEATETEIITSKSDEEVSTSIGIKLDKTTTLSSQDKFTTLKDEIKETTASLLPEKFTGVTDATTVKESEFSDTTTFKHTQESSVTETEISPKTDIIESETTSIAPKTSSPLDITTEAITKVTTPVTTDTSEKELKETELVESVKTTDKFTTEEALITGSEESAVTQTKATDFDEKHLTTKEIQEPKIELTTTRIVKTDAETTTQHFTPIPEIKISSTRKEFEEKEVITESDAEISTIKSKDGVEFTEKSTIKTPTTDLEDFSKTETSFVVEDTVQSNRTFAADSMIVGHSTTSIRETTTETLRDKLTTTTPLYDESAETSRDTKDLTTLSDTFDVTTKKDMFEPHSVESTVKVTTIDFSKTTPIKTDETFSEQTTKEDITLSETEETKSDTSIMGRTTKIVPATSSKESINETFISETPTEFEDASKEIITADIHQTMFTTIPIEISTEGFHTSTVTSKDLTTESSSETVAFEATEGSSTKTDLEEAREEDSRITKVTTQEQEISTPSKEELPTLTTSQIVELTTPEKVTESKFITSSKDQELFEKSSTTPHKTEVTDVATETSEMISVKSTETSLDGELTTLLPSTATSLITEKAFKETHLDQEITLAQEDGVMSTYKTTATQPTLEADATTIAEEITLSTEASKSYSVENITAEISTSSESLPDKTTLSSKNATEKTTEPAGTHITEEFDDRKQFSTILETSTSFEPSSTTKTLEVSTIISTDSDEITPKETVKPTEIPKSITESTVSTTEATVEFRATSTPFGKEETVSVTEIQEGEEEKSSESSSIPEELITSSIRANITSEPPSPVTESTSSTATTTLEAITEVSKHLPGETMITKEEVAPTTILPGETESSITEKHDCFINETLYADGESIWTIEPCDKCHCFRGEMTCFKIICEVPKRGCTPDTVSEDKCCPTSYKCPTEDGSTEIVQTTELPRITEKDLSTPIPISFMFSTTHSSISTTLITSKPDDVKGDEEDISTDKFIPVTETEEASPSTVKITEDTSLDRLTTSAPQLDVKEQTTRVEEKITEISETISSTETTAAVPESITSKSSLTPEIAFDEKAPTTSKVEPTVTVEEHISAEVTTYATADREERFETTVVVDTKSPKEKITESELTTERTPLPYSTKEDTVSTMTPEDKLESTSQTTVSSTSLIKGIEEVTLGKSELTTEKPSFDATTELADTTLSAEKVSATEERISTAGIISSESSEPSTFKIETDYVTTQKSETDGETKSKPAFTITQSSSVSSEPTSIVGDRSTESTVTIESKITTEDLLSDITGTTVVQDQFADSTTTGFTEEVFTEEKSGSSTKAESSTEFSETDKVTKTSAQTEETELKTLPSLAKSSSFETTTLTSSEIGSTTEAESSSVELSSEIKFEDAEKTKEFKTTTSIEKLSTEEESFEANDTSLFTEETLITVQGGSATISTSTEERMKTEITTIITGESFTTITPLSLETISSDKGTETTVRVESEIKDLLSKVTTESVRDIEDVITTLLAEKTSTVEPTENITLITEGIEIELSTQEADVTMISLGETKSEPSLSSTDIPSSTVSFEEAISSLLPELLITDEIKELQNFTEFTTVETEESSMIEEHIGSTSSPIKQPKLDDSITSTVKTYATELSTEKLEVVFTTPRLHETEKSTEVTKPSVEHKTTTIPTEDSSQSSTSKPTEVAELSTKFTETPESGAETTISPLSDGLSKETKLTSDFQPEFSTISETLSTDAEIKLKDITLSETEQTSLSTASTLETFTLKDSSTTGKPFTIFSDKTDHDILEKTTKPDGTTHIEKSTVSESLAPEEDVSSEASSTSFHGIDERKRPSGKTTEATVKMSTELEDTKLPTDQTKITEAISTQGITLKETSTQLPFDAISSSQETSESFETFTEIFETNQTISSLSKETKLPEDENVTDIHLATEIDISKSTLLTDSFYTTTTTEKTQEGETTLSFKTTSGLDHTKADEIFTFVTTRFTDIPRETKPQETSIEDEVKTSIKPVIIQTTTTVTEEESSTSFKPPLLSSTTSEQISTTERPTSFSTSETFVTKEIFTTKEPAVKSLDDVTITYIPYESKTIFTDLEAEEIDNLTTKGVSKSSTVSSLETITDEEQKRITSASTEIPTTSDKIVTSAEEELSSEKESEVTTLFTEQESLTSESTQKDTVVTDGKEQTDVSTVELLSTGTKQEFTKQPALTSEQTKEEGRESTDLLTKAASMDGETSKSFEESTVTPVTESKTDKPLLTTFETRLTEDKLSSQSLFETESSVPEKISSFTTLSDMESETPSTIHLPSVSEESDIGDKITSLTPLISLDLSSTISSLITTTVEELSTLKKDLKLSSSVTEISSSIPEITTTKEVTSEAETKIPLLAETTTQKEDEKTISSESSKAESTTSSTKESVTSGETTTGAEKFTSTIESEPSVKTATDVTEESLEEEVPKSSITKLSESSTTRESSTEKAKSITEEEASAQTTEKAPELITHKDIDVSFQTTESPTKDTETYTREKTESTTHRSTELPTKAYKGIETPLPLLTTPTDMSDNSTATVQTVEEDFLLDEGACIFEGQIYQSAEQIIRADPCEFCFCFRGDIICLQQSCPPPAPNCHQTMIHGYCCPRYDCPVLVTSRNMTSLTRRKGVQPIIIQRRIEKRAIEKISVEVKGCDINGTFYALGDTVTKASGPCLHCVCEDGGNMRCDPQKCPPPPPIMMTLNKEYFKSR